MTIEMTRPTATTGTVDATALRRLCGGQVYLPGDAGYDEARLPWSAAVDQRPAAVAYPRSATDVSEVVRAAAALGLRIAPQSTGHNAGPLAAQGLDDVVVVRLSQLDEVTVDVERQVVRVGGGAVWLPAVEAAAEAGFTVLHGSSPDVGIAGYSLGGGMGWYARSSAWPRTASPPWSMVDAGGTIVRADADTNPRCSGRSAEAEAASAWSPRWSSGCTTSPARTAACSCGTSPRRGRPADLGRLGRGRTGRGDHVVPRATAAPAPGDPRGRARSRPGDHRRRRHGGRGEGTGDPGSAAALDPEIDTFGRVPTRELIRLHMDPEGPTPVTSSTTMLAELPEEAVQAFLRETGPEATTSLLVSEIRQLGGALGRPQPGAGAVSHFEGRFLVFAAAIAATPEMGEQGHADAVRLTEALTAWSNGASPQLRRGAGRRPQRLPRVRLGTAHRHPLRHGPGRPLRGQPPRPPPLRGRPADRLIPQASPESARTCRRPRRVGRSAHLPPCTSADSALWCVHLCRLAQAGPRAGWRGS